MLCVGLVLVLLVLFDPELVAFLWSDVVQAGMDSFLIVPKAMTGRLYFFGKTGIFRNLGERHRTFPLRISFSFYGRVGMILSISFGFCATFDEAPPTNTENITASARHDGAEDRSLHDRNHDA